jgi:carbamoyl-phosphate synthase large subunit
MANKKTVNIMFTCIGRRVSLLNCFKLAVRRAGGIPHIIGSDITKLSPAFQLCDSKELVSPVKSKDYIESMLAVVKKRSVDILVPTVDLDLKKLALSKDKFIDAGCNVLISSPKVIDICQDKRKTFEFLSGNDFDTPLTMTYEEALKSRRLSYPLFLKPWDGYASRGNAVVRNREELKVFGRTVPNCIVQDFVKGDEYTCDCFVDEDMQIRTVVPRKRIEVRSGEVSKGQVVKNKKIMEQACEVVKRLGAGPGVITIQLIANGGGISFIEINPRFGGGVPLSIKAGADFPRWIIEQHFGNRPDIVFDGFKDNLVMLRYDREVWLQV